MVSLDALLLLELSTYSVGFGVLVIIAIGVLVAYLRRAPPASPAASTTPAAPSVLSGGGDTLDVIVGAPEVDRAAFLSRFVVNARGETVGETVGFHGDEVILKDKGMFMAVPMRQVIEKEGSLVAAADVDWDAAKSAGEAWRASTADEMRYDEHGMPIPDGKA